MSSKSAVVMEGRLYDPQREGATIGVDSPAWFAWLDAPQTTSFSYALFDANCGYIVGFLTVRKEGRQRGGSYWMVYHRRQGRVRKVYLGKAQCVTRARLVAIVRTVLAERSQCSEEEVKITEHH